MPNAHHVHAPPAPHTTKDRTGMIGWKVLLDLPDTFCRSCERNGKEEGERCKKSTGAKIHEI
jgi:hypothetical protein